MSTLAGLTEPSARSARLYGICAAVVVLLTLTPALCQASTVCPRRPQDEIWLVSARHVCSLQSEETPPLETEYYDPDTGWRDANVSELFQPASPDQILMVYVHGNRVSSGEAACDGRYVYCLITSQVEDPVSVRYVIWSWPSSRVRGQLRDVRVKAARTELAGYCLGWFLAQLPRQQRVSLLGYSFGARIVSGALQLQSGDQLSGRRLLTHPEPAPQARVVMLAGALHRTWLRPGCYHENALVHMDYLLNLFNSRDPVLKRYPLLYKGSHPQALGYTGLYTGDFGTEERERIEQHDVRDVVGASHAAIRYFKARHLRTLMQETLFWHPLRDDAADRRS